jgi:hypothetical protein
MAAAEVALSTQGQTNQTVVMPDSDKAK